MAVIESITTTPAATPIIVGSRFEDYGAIEIYLGITGGGVTRVGVEG